VVRPPVLAGEVSLSCARLTAACRVITLWVKRPLSVNQHVQLSQPSLRGKITKVRTLPLSGTACASGRAVARNLCVQAVGGGLERASRNYSVEY